MALNGEPSMTETSKKIRNNDKILHFPTDSSLLDTATDEKAEPQLAAGKGLCMDGRAGKNS